MYYLSKKNKQQPTIEKTYTEIEEMQYKNSKIYLEKNRYKTLSIVFAITAAILLTVSNLLEAKDGAGDNWSCSNCGYSNKFYEMSCGNCGKWR